MAVIAFLLLVLVFCVIRWKSSEPELKDKEGDQDDSLRENTNEGGELDWENWIWKFCLSNCYLIFIWVIFFVIKDEIDKLPKYNFHSLHYFIIANLVSKTVLSILSMTHSEKWN